MGEQRITVLHVDDEPGKRELVSDLLEDIDERFSVVTAKSGDEALTVLANREVDCVVSDYEMPRMDGLELLEQVRDSYGDLPFVLFTGRGSEEIASEAISMGVTDYLQKGSDKNTYDLLANRVTNAVAQRRAERRASERTRNEDLINRINQHLVRASNRREILRGVCEVLGDVATYDHVWLGEWDDCQNRLRRRVSTDGGETLLGDGEQPDVAETTAETPLQTALETRELQVVDVSDGTIVSPLVDVPDESAYRVAAVVPLDQPSNLKGVVVLYSNRPEAFTSAERSMLEVVSTNVAHGIETRDAQRRLRQQKHALEQERDHRAALFENSDVPMLRVDFEEGTPVIEHVNAAFESVFGFIDSEVRGTDLEETLVPPAQRAEAREHQRRLFEGEAVRAEISAETARGRRDFQLHVTPIAGDDMSVGAYAWLRDISERRDHERELERYRQFTEDVLDTVSDVIVIRDQDGNVVGCNQRMVEVTGYSRDELTSMEVDALVPDDDEAAVSAAMNTAFEEGTAKLESEIVTASGDTIPFEFAISQVSDLDGNELVAGIGRDVTERRERERRLAEFADVVCHELRNPLNVAQARLEMVDVDEQDEHVPIVDRSLNRIESIIEQTRQLARHGQVVEETDRVALPSLATDCWASVASGRARLETHGQPTVEADGERLRHLFENLFRNAVEHGSTNPRQAEDEVEHGDPEVTVTVGPLADRPGFYVEDDGTGIPAEDRERVLESGYTTASEGTGLGLAMVDRIAMAHDWTLGIEESVDGGARFEFVTD